MLNRCFECVDVHDMLRSTGTKRFSRIKRGFDPEAVTAYLAEIDQRVRAGNPIPAHEIMNKTFAFRKKGYDPADVCRFLYSVAGGDAESLTAPEAEVLGLPEPKELASTTTPEPQHLAA